MPLLVITVSSVFLFGLVIKKANCVNAAKLSMILWLSVISMLAWTPSIIYGTVLKTGHHDFFRLGNYVIAVDATFSTPLFAFFYPSFRQFIWYFLTCGRHGVLNIVEAERSKVVEQNQKTLKSRIQKSFSRRSMELQRAMGRRKTRSVSVNVEDIRVKKVSLQVLRKKQRSRSLPTFDTHGLNKKKSV